MTKTQNKSFSSSTGLEKYTIMDKCVKKMPVAFHKVHVTHTYDDKILTESVAKTWKMMD